MFNVTTRNSVQSENPCPLPIGSTRPAFTLVELLVVMAVIIALIALAVPAIKGLKGSGDMSKAVYDIVGVLEQARAYALANNTYAYVGMGEFDASKPEGGAQTTGTGRIAVAVVATRDGTRGYSPYIDDVYSTWTTPANYATTSANLAVVGKLQRFDNLHLIDPDPTQIPASGSTHRPAVSDVIFRLGNAGSETATPFTNPMSNTLSGNYKFTRVIQFDPQGQARSLPKTIPANFHASSLPDRIEMAFQASNGAVAAPTPANQQTGNFCVLQIDGMTGVVTIYRP